MMIADGLAHSPKLSLSFPQLVLPVLPACVFQTTLARPTPPQVLFSRVKSVALPTENARLTRRSCRQFPPAPPGGALPRFWPTPLPPAFAAQRRFYRLSVPLAQSWPESGDRVSRLASAEGTPCP